MQLSSTAIKTSCCYQQNAFTFLSLVNNSLFFAQCAAIGINKWALVYLFNLIKSVLFFVIFLTLPLPIHRSVNRGSNFSNLNYDILANMMTRKNRSWQNVRGTCVVDFAIIARNLTPEQMSPALRASVYFHLFNAKSPCFPKILCELSEGSAVQTTATNAA